MACAQRRLCTYMPRSTLHNRTESRALVADSLITAFARTLCPRSRRSSSCDIGSELSALASSFRFPNSVRLRSPSSPPLVTSESSSSPVRYVHARAMPIPIPVESRQSLVSADRSDSFEIPGPILEQMNKALVNGWAASTRLSYAHGLRRFLAFCDSMAVPENFRLPADELLLCAFAGSFAGSKSRSAAQNSLSGVRAWHTVMGFDWAGGSRLAQVISGVERLAPYSSTQPLRKGVTVEMLTLLYHCLDFSSPLDVCIYACALCAFWTQSRLGELLPTSSSVASASGIPRRRDLRAASSANGSCELFLWAN